MERIPNDREQVEELRGVIRSLWHSCEGDSLLESHGRADWLAVWSDRHMFVCNDHKNEAQKAHDGDHTQDRTGISWTKLTDWWEEGYTIVCSHQKREWRTVCCNEQVTGYPGSCPGCHGAYVDWQQVCRECGEVVAEEE